MTLLQAIVLGIVQGLTEFLPVSSTAHLRIVPALFGWHFYGGSTNDPGAPFTAVIQLGTTAAIVIYFWRELLHVIVAWFRGLFDKSVRGSLEYRFGWYLIVATIPVGRVRAGVQPSDRNRRPQPVAHLLRVDRAGHRARRSGEGRHPRPRGGADRPHRCTRGGYRTGTGARPRRVTLRHDDHRWPVPRPYPRGGGPLLLPALHTSGGAVRAATRRATSATRADPASGSPGWR